MLKQSFKNDRNGEVLALTGKSKKDIFDELGDGFNFFPDNIWSYELKKNWYGSKLVLFIFFEDGVVKSHVEKKVFGKLSKVCHHKK